MAIELREDGTYVVRAQLVMPELEPLRRVVSQAQRLVGYPERDQLAPALDAATTLLCRLAGDQAAGVAIAGKHGRKVASLTVRCAWQVER